MRRSGSWPNSGAGRYLAAAAGRTASGTTPAAGRSTVVPDHGGKDLKYGTLRAAVRQLGLDWAAFEQA